MLLLGGIVSLMEGDKVLPVLITAISTFGIFTLGLISKDFIETRILSSKLITEHNFDQRKKIKEALAKYKVQLLLACEDLNHRMYNLARYDGKKEWGDINNDYTSEHYYLHSFAYRILCVYAWVEKIQQEMIFLDTTIASKEDVEFVKFLRAFPEVLCDITSIEGADSTGGDHSDHFFKHNFDSFVNCVKTDEGVKTYDMFLQDLPQEAPRLKALFAFLYQINSAEARTRWDRIHLLNLMLIIFLNNYGYDFQQTDDSQMEQAIIKPRVSRYLKNYFLFLKQYRLDQNKEVKRMENIARKYY